MEGTIQQLFEGHHMNYIECINVDYKSTRKESFYGIVYTTALYCLIIPNQRFRRFIMFLSLILWQTFSWMLKAARMFMLLLTNMLKLNALKETTNIMQKDMVYRLVVLTLSILLSGMVESFTAGLFWYLATVFFP